jgi:hypothetical protein
MTNSCQTLYIRILIYLNIFINKFLGKEDKYGKIYIKNTIFIVDNLKIIKFSKETKKNLI